MSETNAVPTPHDATKETGKDDATKETGKENMDDNHHHDDPATKRQRV